MMGKLKFWFFVIIILFLNAIILYISLGKKDNIYELFYGKRIPRFSIIDIKGNNISLKNKYNLLYFSNLDSSGDIRTARYLDKLYNKYNNYGLLIIGIIEKDKNSIEKFRIHENINYPLLYYKNDSNLKNDAFNSLVSSQFHGIILLDSSNVIRFVSSFFRADDIRQIIEKFLFGNISYPPLEPTKSLEEGDIFPSISVKNLKDGRLEYFPCGEDTIAIILTGRCPDCVISNFKITYYLLEGRLINSKKSIALVFSSKFLEKDILQNFHDVNSEILLATDNIPGIEDPFNSIFYFQDEIIVAQLNEEGTVTALDSLDDFIKEINRT